MTSGERCSEIGGDVICHDGGMQWHGTVSIQRHVASSYKE